MSAPTGADLLELALRTARSAAALVRERAAAEVTVAATKSSDVDVVTQTDRDSEELIRSAILSERPGDAFLGEEGDDVVGTTGVRWIVDPIDGTVNFLYGLPEYAISIAAEASQLELNMAEPIIAYDLLHGLLILKNACITLESRCVRGITANEDVCRWLCRALDRRRHRTGAEDRLRARRRDRAGGSGERTQRP